MTTGAPDVSVVLVAQPQNASATLAAVRSLLLAQTASTLAQEIVLVDNATPERLADVLSPLGRLQCARAEHPCAMGEALSYGVGMSRAPLVVLMDGRSSVASGWLEPLVQSLAHDAAASAVMPVVRTPDGGSWGGCELRYGERYPLGVRPLPMRSEPVYPVSVIAPHAVIVRRSLLEKVGGLDPLFGDWGCFVHLSLQLRANKRLMLVDTQSVLTTPEAPATLPDVDADRLQEIWLPRFRGFDSDARAQALPVVPDSAHPPVSVVLMADPKTPRSVHALFAACESLRLSLRRQDELVLVDNGSSAAASALCVYVASQHPSQVKPLKVDASWNAQKAAAFGLAACGARHAAVLWGDPQITLQRLLEQGQVRPIETWRPARA